MSRARVAKERLEKKGVLFLAIYLETENSSVVFLSEGEDRLGTLAVSMPQEEKMVGPPLSSVLLGDRNATIARILAERLAQTMNKIALVSVFTKTVDDREAAPILLKLVRKITEREAVEP